MGSARNQAARAPERQPRPPPSGEHHRQPHPIRQTVTYVFPAPKTSRAVEISIRSGIWGERDAAFFWHGGGFHGGASGPGRGTRTALSLGRSDDRRHPRCLRERAALVHSIDEGLFESDRSVQSERPRTPRHHHREPARAGNGG